MQQEIPYRKQSTFFHPLTFIHKELPCNRDNLLHVLVLNTHGCRIQSFHYSGLWLGQVRNYKESKAMRHCPRSLPIIPPIQDAHIWLWPQIPQYKPCPTSYNGHKSFAKVSSYRERNKSVQKSVQFLNMSIDFTKIFSVWHFTRFDILQ